MYIQPLTNPNIPISWLFCFVVVLIYIWLQMRPFLSLKVCVNWMTPVRMVVLVWMMESTKPVTVLMVLLTMFVRQVSYTLFLAASVFYWPEKIFPEGGVVDWLEPYWKWASSVYPFRSHLGKTLSLILASSSFNLFLNFYLPLNKV